jgi:glycosyltransferase involved in cell wall biosynthesis
MYLDLFAIDINYNKKVRVIYHEKNYGLLQARYTGTKASTGDWILHVDSDDYLIAGALWTLSYFIEDKYDIIYFRTKQDDGSIVPYITVPELSAEHALKALLKFRTIQGYSVTKCVRRDLMLNTFDSINGNSMPYVNMAEDQLTSSYLFLINTKPIRCIPNGLYFYDDFGMTKKLENPSPEEQEKYYISQAPLRKLFDDYFEIYETENNKPSLTEYEKHRAQILYSICRISRKDYCESLMDLLCMDFSYDVLETYSKKNWDVFKDWLPYIKKQSELIDKG